MRVYTRICLPWIIMFEDPIDEMLSERLQFARRPTFKPGETVFEIMGYVDVTARLTDCHESQRSAFRRKQPPRKFSSCLAEGYVECGATVYADADCPRDLRTSAIRFSTMRGPWGVECWTGTPIESELGLGVPAHELQIGVSYWLPHGTVPSANVGFKCREV